MAGIILITAFCLGGRWITEDNYQAAFFWPLYAVGLGLGLTVCLHVLTRRQR